MVDLVKICLPRQRVSCYFVGVCAVMLMLMQLAAAERFTSFTREALCRDSSTGCNPNPKSTVTKSGDTTTSMMPIDEDSPWLKNLENLSRRIFRLGNEEPPKWPNLKLTQLRTILGIIFGGLGAGLSSAGGLGGGGLFVPLFNLMFQFDPKTSAVLSNFMILGGSVVNLIINVQQHHPIQRNKPVIEFDVLLLMQPNMLLGISIGVILNVVLPAWFITAALAVVLGYMTVHSTSGGLKRWKRETIQNNASREALEVQSQVPISITSSPSEDEVAEAEKFSAPPTSPDGENDTTPLKQPLLAPRTEVPPRRVLHLIPRMKVAALFITWLAFFAVQVLRGGKGGESILGLKQCGIGYWLLTATQVPLALILTAWTINQLHHTHGVPRKDDPKHYDIEEEGYRLGPEAACVFPLMALVAGILGGMLGIGGGMIINPMLQTVGMLPQVTAATCVSTVFFSSSMSVIQYWLLGRIPVKYAVISAVLCAIFSWFGIVIVQNAIKKYNRASIIVFSVAAVMGVSAILMCGFGGWDVWKQYEGGAYMGFHYPC